jgi:hypothetical protein
MPKSAPEPLLVWWFSEQFWRDLSKEAVMVAMFGAVITSSVTEQIPEYVSLKDKSGREMIWEGKNIVVISQRWGFVLFIPWEISGRKTSLTPYKCA